MKLGEWIKLVLNEVRRIFRRDAKGDLEDAKGDLEEIVLYHKT